MLASEGGKTARFRPLTLFPPNLGINLRSHRKVLVCDGTGFTGGLNIADGNVSCLAKKEGIKAIHDMHFRFEGPVVSQLRGRLLLNWAFCTNRYTPRRRGGKRRQATPPAGWLLTARETMRTCLTT